MSPCPVPHLAFSAAAPSSEKSTRTSCARRQDGNSRGFPVLGECRADNPHFCGSKRFRNSTPFVRPRSPCTAAQSLQEKKMECWSFAACQHVPSLFGAPASSTAPRPRPAAMKAEPIGGTPGLAGSLGPAPQREKRAAQKHCCPPGCLCRANTHCHGHRRRSLHCCAGLRSPRARRASEGFFDVACSDARFWDLHTCPLLASARLHDLSLQKIGSSADCVKATGRQRGRECGEGVYLGYPVRDAGRHGARSIQGYTQGCVPARPHSLPLPPSDTQSG